MRMNLMQLVTISEFIIVFWQIHIESYILDIHGLPARPTLEYDTGWLLHFMVTTPQNKSNEPEF